MKINSSKNNIKSITERVNSKLKAMDLEKIAYEEGFQRRKAQKITAKNFLMSFFLMALGNGRKTLEMWATKLAILTNDTVSRQAVLKKMTPQQIEFLKRVLEKAIRKTCKIQNKSKFISKKFRNIWLQDSTCLTLKGSLAKDYPGNANQFDRPKAILKINVIYNLLSNTFRNFSLNSYRDSDYDQSSKILQYAKKGDLVLRDLGYFVMSAFQDMDTKGIYFISKLKPTVKLYEEFQEVDLVKLLKGKDYLDKTLQISSKYKNNYRLIAIRLNKKIVAQRKKKVNNRRYIHSKQYNKLLEYVIFITNVGTDKLSIKQISELYRLRWRIEVIFKCWKSYCFLIDVIAMNNKIRVESYIYCMLIFIVLFLIDFYSYIEDLSSLSLLKFSKFFTNNFFYIISKQLSIRSFQKQISYYCSYQQRPDRINFTQLLAELG